MSHHRCDTDVTSAMNGHNWVVGHASWFSDTAVENVPSIVPFNFSPTTGIVPPLTSLTMAHVSSDVRDVNPWVVWRRLVRGCDVRHVGNDVGSVTENADILHHGRPTCVQRVVRKTWTKYETYKKDLSWGGPKSGNSGRTYFMRSPHTVSRHNASSSITIR